MAVFYETFDKRYRVGTNNKVSFRIKRVTAELSSAETFGSKTANWSLAFKNAYPIFLSIDWKALEKVITSSKK